MEKTNETALRFPSEILNDKTKTYTVMNIIPDPNGGHANKMPLDPRNGEIMKWKKDPYFLNASDALKWQQEIKRDNPNANVQLGMLVGVPWGFLDIDDIGPEIEDAKKGKLSPRLKKIRELTHNSYCEISQSGEGLHVLIRGVKTRNESRRNGYEFYDSNRWASLTGNSLDPVPAPVQSLTADEMEQLCQYIFGDPQPATRQKLIDIKTGEIKVGNSVEDTELLNVIKKSKDAEDFLLLWSGGSLSGKNGGQPDQSLDDFYLCRKLIFWTNHDIKRALQLFQASPRYQLRKDKWDAVHYSSGDTYGYHTMLVADKSVEDGYQPKQKHSALPEFPHNPKNMQELHERLRVVSDAWHAINDEIDSETGKVTKRAVMSVKVTCDLLEKYVKFRLIYSDDVSEVEDAPLSFYNYDKNIFEFSTFELNRMLNEINPDMTSDKQRRDAKSTLKASGQTKIVQLSKKVNEGLVCFNNCVYDLISEKAYPFDPDKWVFTQKISCNYNPDAVVEPVLGPKLWRVTTWFWEIAGGTPENIPDFSASRENVEKEVAEHPEIKEVYDKFRALCEVCFVIIFGIADTRQGYFVIDHNLGSTSKSTFLEFIRCIIGKVNCADIDITQFDQPALMVQALNKQAIIGDDFDVDKNAVIKSSKPFKKIVDKGGSVPVWKMRENRWNAVINAPVLQAANGMPRFADSGRPVYDRMLVILFDHQFDRTDPENQNVKNKYIENKEVHEWFVNFLIHFAKHIHGPIKQTRESLNEIYNSRTTEDPFESFCKSYLDSLTSGRVPSSWLYAMYRNSVLADGYKLGDIVSRKKFSQLMSDPNNHTGWHLISKNQRVKGDFDEPHDSKIYADVLTRCPSSQSSRFESTLSLQEFRGSVFERDGYVHGKRSTQMITEKIEKETNGK